MMVSLGSSLASEGICLFADLWDESFCFVDCFPGANNSITLQSQCRLFPQTRRSFSLGQDRDTGRVDPFFNQDLET